MINVLNCNSNRCLFLFLSHYMVFDFNYIWINVNWMDSHIWNWVHYCCIILSNNQILMVDTKRQHQFILKNNDWIPTLGPAMVILTELMAGYSYLNFNVKVPQYFLPKLRLNNCLSQSISCPKLGKRIKLRYFKKFLSYGRQTKMTYNMGSSSLYEFEMNVLLYL